MVNEHLSNPTITSSCCRVKVTEGASPNDCQRGPRRRLISHCISLSTTHAQKGQEGGGGGGGRNRYAVLVVVVLLAFLVDYVCLYSSFFLASFIRRAPGTVLPRKKKGARDD